MLDKYLKMIYTNKKKGFMTKNDFLNMVKEVCSKNSFELKLVDEPSINIAGIACGGVFDRDNKELIVATKRDEELWFGILAHEFNHLKQFLEGHPYFQKEILDDAIFDDWVNGKEVNNIEEIIKNIQLLEYDCEKRTIELIKDYQLPIDLDYYIKMSNIYVLSHNLMLKKRKFLSRSIKDLAKTNIFPTSLINDLQTNEYDSYLEELFD